MFHSAFSDEIEAEGKKTKAKAKGKSAKDKKAAANKVSNQCGTAGCEDRHKLNSKYCKKHHPIYESAKYQAQKKEAELLV